MPTVIRSIIGLPDWLRGLQAAIYDQQPCVLVTLVKAQGSVPREAGARMLMTARGCCGTIGGGRLEWQASKRARSLLAQPEAISSLEIFVLGSQLDQCCGGVASVHYEYFPLANVVWFETLLERWQQGLSTTLRSYPQLWPHTGRGRDLVEASSKHGIQLLEPVVGEFLLIESFVPSSAHLVIFGAGHVAQALVQILLPLD
ncbi:XdhC family protein [uncultured Thiothrix sp.]|uniref:XdhC family protein n=1 Tax=uncultured Thiothrix sp. TaxID=223185 RepID=UPI002635988B|nr:XdhC family protein [uncultured Thiothrix sp.]HMT94428.1 XdhC family protein [Thiolinea sp.]